MARWTATDFGVVGLCAVLFIPGPWAFWPLGLWLLSERRSAARPLRVTLALLLALTVYHVYMIPLQAVIGGPLYTVYFIGGMFSLIGEGGFHLFAVPAAFGALVLTVAFYALDGRCGRFVAGLLSITAGLATAHFAKDAWIGGVVRMQAERAAAGRPYALRAEDMGQHVIDVMRASGIGGPGDGGWRWPHALLATEEDCYHWSYAKAVFVRYDKPREQTACDGVAIDIGFSGIAYVEERAAYELMVVGVRYSIPEAYEPRRISPSYIALSAAAPDFVADLNLPPTQGLSVDIGNVGWLQSLAEDARSLPVVNYGGPLIAVEPDWTNGTRRQFYRVDADGQVQTLVACYEDRGAGSKDCQHWFVSSGDLYQFDHDRADLARVDEMQERVVALFEEFRVPPFRE